MGKLIFITDAAGRIGQATARRFSRAGWRVAISDVHLDGLNSLGAELGPNLAASVLLDVNDSEAVVASLKSVADSSDAGCLDLLANNAGLAYIEPFQGRPLAFHNLLVSVNTQGVLNCTYLAYPHLKAACGQVVNL